LFVSNANRKQLIDEEEEAERSQRAESDLPQSSAAYRCEQQLDDDIDRATIISHSEWEKRIADAKSRRRAVQEAVGDEEHSTSILDAAKTWALGLWTKAKAAVSAWWRR
jgi:hypothetical protein